MDKIQLKPFAKWVQSSYINYTSNSNLELDLIIENNDKKDIIVKELRIEIIGFLWNTETNKYSKSFTVKANKSFTFGYNLNRHFEEYGSNKKFIFVVIDSNNNKYKSNKLSIDGLNSIQQGF